MLMGALIFFTAGVISSSFQGNLKGFLLLPLVKREFFFSLIYLSLLSSNVAFLMNVTAIGLVGPTITSSFSGLTTLISVFAGVIFLGESFLLQQWAAAAMIILGVFLANRR
jgi:drug/metabolite transporter (DMT)-like permease